MKKFLITIILSGSLFFGLFLNYTPNYAFAQNININLGQAAKNQGVIGSSEYNPEDTSAGFGSFIGRMLTIVVFIAALALLIMLLWGAIEWIAAGGDKSKIEKARNRITQSIIGMIVLAAVIALFSLLQTTLNFRVFNISGGTSGGSNYGSSTCLVTGELENDGGAGNYCSQGSAMVRCFPPEGNLQYNHYNPCYCVDGSQYQISGYNFDSC